MKRETWQEMFWLVIFLMIVATILVVADIIAMRS